MNMLGKKNNLDLFNNLISSFIPNSIKIYVEPFGGTFGLYNLIKEKVDFSVYNELNPNIFEQYKNKANVSFNLDYKLIINKFDSKDTFFYIDPPYYKKEHYYDYTFKNINEHIELFNILNNIEGKFLLSYNNSDIILNLYNNYTISNYKGNDRYHKNEIVITNVNKK